MKIMRYLSIVSYIIFSSANKTITLWNYNTGKIEREYNLNTSKAFKLCWNHHNLNTNFFLSGHDNGYIYYWDINQEESILSFRLRNQTSPIRHISIHPQNGKLFACTHEDLKVFVWNMADNYKPNYYFQFDKTTIDCIEWHSTDPDILLTGTKTIQFNRIFSKGKEISQDTLLNINCLNGKVSCFKWRPGFDHHL